MNKTVKEIAEFIGGRVEGDGNVVIRSVSGLKEAVPGDITFLANSKYQPLIKESGATAIIMPEGVKLPEGKVAIRHENPSLAFAKIMESLRPSRAAYSPGIHPTAVIGNDVQLGKNITIMPYVVIEDGASVGDNTVLEAGCFVGQKTSIGADTLIYPHVVIREEVKIGSRCIIHSGTVIGCDGFGYATVKGVHQKIPQIGTVIIEDDVEIGANVTIDRARFDRTLIRRGTKIDNLVQIAHNVVIGENTIICAQTGISGSTVIGKNVILAGQSGVAGHIEIGDNVIVGGQAGVTKSIPEGRTVSGYPATRHDKAKKIQALVNMLPKLYEKVQELEKRIFGENNM